MNLEYVRLSEGLGRGNLVPIQDAHNHITKIDKDYYQSIFIYNDEQYAHWEKTKSVAGIVDVLTNRLVWDFDSSNNLDEAKEDAKTLCTRLIERGIPKDDIFIAFSGMKGFSIEVIADKQRFTPDEFRNINLALAEGLKTNDTKILDAARIFRVVGTKHPKSGLYKFPLTFNQLFELPVKTILELAADINNAGEVYVNPVNIPKGITDMAAQPLAVAPKLNSIDVSEISQLEFSSKPKGFSNCKFAIMHGFFPAGCRNNALMALAATYKHQGYPSEVAYGALKGAARLQAQREGTAPYSKDEIWNNIIKQVYGPHWKGAMYSCKNQPWLKEICDSLGPHKCKTDEDEKKAGYVDVMSAFEDFEQFAKDIEKNTIKTGIRLLDDTVRFRTGQMIGILAAPSGGKTSIGLELLENVSRQGLLSVFYSLDMSSSELFQKLAQRVTGMQEAQLFDIIKNDPQGREEIKKKVCAAYENVKFCFDTGVSVDRIEESIREFESKHGRKVSLLLLDYNELLSSPYSDATASSGHNAGLLKKLTNLNQVCTISLLQPPKIVGDARDEIVSYRSIKGSSLLEQCFSIVIGVFRPGFSAENNSEDDKYLVMNLLKNRLGKLHCLKFRWDGLRGRISETDDEDVQHIEKLIWKNRNKDSSND
jgi:replicative DNA helicase